MAEHPMRKYKAHGTMGDFWSDTVNTVEDWATETIKDPIESVADDIVGEENRERLTSEIEKAYQEELNKQKKSAFQQVSELITGESPTGDQKTGDTLKDIDRQIREISQVGVLSYIPGGLYTVMGVAVIGGFWFFTRR